MLYLYILRVSYRLTASAAVVFLSIKSGGTLTMTNLRLDRDSPGLSLNADLTSLRQGLCGHYKCLFVRGHPLVASLASARWLRQMQQIQSLLFRLGFLRWWYDGDAHLYVIVTTGGVNVTP